MFPRHLPSGLTDACRFYLWFMVVTQMFIWLCSNVDMIISKLSTNLYAVFYSIVLYLALFKGLTGKHYWLGYWDNVYGRQS